jgi:hypothetical protein
MPRWSPVNPANQASRCSLVVPVLPATALSGGSQFLSGRGDKVHRFRWESLLHRERVALERPAVLGRHLAYRAQRRAESAARDGLVHLRHFEGGEVHRAEERRGVRLHLALDAQALDGVEDFLDADIGPEARGRGVVGLRERRAQRHRAVEGLVVVRRLPVRRPAALPHERPVVDRRHEGVVRGIAQRREVDRGFE